MDGELVKDLEEYAADHADAYPHDAVVKMVMRHAGHLRSKGTTGRPTDEEAKAILGRLYPIRGGGPAGGSTGRRMPRDPFFR